MIPNKFQTVLVEEGRGKDEPDPSHPLFYYKHRNDYLTQLSDRYSTQHRLQTMDLKRNAKVGYYLSEYQKQKAQIDRKRSIENSYLKSDQFESIFSEQIDERRQKERQRKEREKLKQDLQNMWFEEEKMHEPPEKDADEHVRSTRKKVEHGDSHDGHDDDSGENRFRTIFMDYREDPVKQKEIYLLDLEIGRLKLEESLDRKVHDKLNSCQNEKLLSKMSNNILSAYMVHFDEIYSSLIDEILEEEVYYLNYLEAEYKVEKDEWSRDYGHAKEKIKYQDTKTLKMMELVKKLDELCDE